MRKYSFLNLEIADRLYFVMGGVERNINCINTNGKSNLFFFLYEITIIRCFIKWIIRLLYGTCELQRILKNNSGGLRTLKIEQCMMRSKSSLLREVIQKEPTSIDSSINEVMTLKKIIGEKCPRFAIEMKLCLEQVYGYDSLYQTVEEGRIEKYDSTNEEHEKMLLKLWDLLQPNEVLQNRVSKQWGNIGFQGDDPQTDFRGMGLLGLQNLLFFAEVHTDAARQVLLHSQHPQYGYSYAIVGINITSMTYELLTNGLLRSHFYNEVADRPKLDDFHQVYLTRLHHVFLSDSLFGRVLCSVQYTAVRLAVQNEKLGYLFYEFDKFWMKSEPENVMAFGRIRDEFKQTIEAVLKFASSFDLHLQQQTEN